jgi:hypothetical protein
MRPSTGRIIIDFRLNNGLVSNNEYSNGDGQLTNSIQPADDVLTVVAVLWFVWRACPVYWAVCWESLKMHTPKCNPSRIWTNVAKRFLLAHRANNIHVYLCGACQIADVHQPFQSLNKHCIQRSITKWYTLCCCTPCQNLCNFNLLIHFV